jgi:hypothetical protein
MGSESMSRENLPITGVRAQYLHFYAVPGTAADELLPIAVSRSTAELSIDGH